MASETPSGAEQASAKKKPVKKKESFGEILRTVIYAVLIAVVLRTIAYEPFVIPSRSMLPTLLVGDYLFVSKFTYGYSKHSVPLSPPLFSGRVFESPVERGDVVVFKLPTDNSTDYIKRIIGVPGDRIQVTKGELILNDKVVPRKYIREVSIRQHGGRYSRGKLFEETLPSGVSYMTLDQSNSYADNTQVYTVPAGHYFAMGDNRDDSTDSRFLKDVGYIPAENLVGRASIFFFSVNGKAEIWEFWRWFGAIRFDRLLSTAGYYQDDLTVIE
jgi:signal peptidase I